MEDAGLRVELVSKEGAVASASSKVELRLRVLDPKKRKDKHKENEAIQFEYDIENDDADQMAQGMVRVLAWKVAVSVPRSLVVVRRWRCIAPAYGVTAVF